MRLGKGLPQDVSGEDPVDPVVFLVLGLIFYRYSSKVGKQVPNEHIDLSQVSRACPSFHQMSQFDSRR
jgi:hypothetical protein